METLRALGRQPVEVVTGFVMLALGIYVTTEGAEAGEARTGLLAAGSVLTSFAGILLSWIASKAFGARPVRQEYNRHLDALSRNLGQAASHISRVVEQAQCGELSSATAFALTSQGARMIYGQVAEIAVIRGEEFNSAYLLETASHLDNLARQLESGAANDERIEDVRRQLGNVRSTLASKGLQRAYSVANVECPYCEQENGVELGDVPGDTAAAVCTKCGERFNAHRSSSGGAFSRQMGPSANSSVRRGAVGSWRFSCPTCGDEMVSSGGERRMVCVNCHEGLLVNALEEKVESTGKYMHSLPPIVSGTNSRPSVECPTCSKLLTAIISSGSSFFAYCQNDQQLMEVPCASFAEWRGEAE